MNELYVVVRGNVTGVGFRAGVAARANALGLNGWVKNKDTGVVEAVFQGNPLELRKILDLIKQGSNGLRVESVEDFWRTPSEIYNRFGIV